MDLFFYCVSLFQIESGRQIHSTMEDLEKEAWSSFFWNSFKDGHMTDIHFKQKHCILYIYNCKQTSL